MFAIPFIIFYLILIFFIGKFFIESFRRFILTYRIFGKRKKRDFQLSAPIPNSAGIVFLFLLILTSFLFIPFLGDNELINIIIGASIITVSGFWDDLKGLNPYQKIIYQLIALSFVIYFNDLSIINLHGFLGIKILPFWFGFSFALFIGVFMINSFNLIDGIDGLAGFISIIAFTSFSVLFWTLNYKGYFGICLTMIGLIASYLPYNFSKNRKLLMGDSGALLIGYLLFVMSITFVNNLEPIVERLIDNRCILPIAPMVIFILPLVDTFSMYTYRVAAGESPFSADRLHLHHIVLSYTKSHLMSSLLISLIVLLIIVSFSLLAFKVNGLNFISIFFGVFLLLVIIVQILRKKQKKSMTSMTN